MSNQIGKIEVVTTRPANIQIDNGEPNLVLLSTSGPKVAYGTLESIEDMDTSDKVDKSVVYYDGNSDMFKADSLYTVITLTDGGNF
jgi:hypothetical protein